MIRKTIVTSYKFPNTSKLQLETRPTITHIALLESLMDLCLKAEVLTVLYVLHSLDSGNLAVAGLTVAGIGVNATGESTLDASSPVYFCALTAQIPPTGGGRIPLLILLLLRDPRPARPR